MVYFIIRSYVLKTKKHKMKQLLFLLLFPCLALAQYPANGNQKISLGEQTTADGLVFRGVANDTNVITPFSDTSAYIILDTVNSKFYHYNRTTTYWSLAGGGVSVSSFSAGTTGLTPSTATTGAVTLAGTLAVANGGTNLTTFTSANRVPYSSSATQLTTSENLTFDNNALILRKNSNGTQFTTFPNIAVENTSTSGFSFAAIKVSANIGDNIVIGDILADGLGTLGTPSVAFRTVTNHPFAIFTNNTERIRVNTSGEVWIAGTTDRGAYNLQVNGTGVWGAGDYVNGSDLNIKDNIQNLDSSLYLINLLAPVMYNYKEEYNKDESKQIGFIAQDVYNVLSNTEFSNAIVKSDGDTLSMAYSSFIPLLTKAIQEQNLLIKALEQRILILENK
jgi:hypothetical protein